jgi:hypothetical protein
MMELLLTVLSGIAWTLVYIESIRIGFQHQTYAMPVAALALNIAWETVYGVHGLMTALSVQGVVNIIWALTDLVIVYTYFRFGRSELPAFVTGPLFLAWARSSLAAPTSSRGCLSYNSTGRQPRGTAPSSRTC